MLVITLGLSAHPTDTFSFDEDGCSDFTNRLGRKLKRLGLLHVDYILDVMRLAQRGGYIRWHMVNVNWDVLSSNIRCQNTYSVSFGFERPSSDMLDKRRLREFVQGLGDDLDDLRKLERNQVDYVLGGIYEVGMVDFVMPSQEPMDLISMPYKIDSASLTDAMSLSNADGDCTSSGLSNPEMDVDNEFDHILNEFYDSGQSVLSMTATNTVGEERPAGITTSPEPMFMEDQADSTVSPFASLDSENSPSANQPLTTLDPPLPTGSSMHYTSTPESIATIASEKGTSPYYMTPPSSVGSPLAVQPISPRWPLSGNSTHDWREHHITRQLQCCRFRREEKKGYPSDENWGTLSNEQISHIIKAWDCVLPRGPLGFVLELPEKNASMPIRQALGLPGVWQGIEGAVNYFRVLEADQDGLSTLGPLARRFAQIFLFLNFEILSVDGHGTVVNCVLDACRDEPSIAQLREFRRGRFSSTHLIRTLSSHKFTNDQIDAFITCVLRMRPGTVRLFESLDPVTMPLLYGNSPVDIRQKLENVFTGLLRRDAINSALEEDQEVLALELTWNTWETGKTETFADESKTQFLAMLHPSG